MRCKKLNQESGLHCGHAFVLGTARRSSCRLEQTYSGFSEKGRPEAGKPKAAPPCEAEIKAVSEQKSLGTTGAPHAQGSCPVMGRCSGPR